MGGIDLFGITSDELSQREIKEIRREVSARNIGKNREPLPFATPDETAYRRYKDPQRLHVQIFEQSPFSRDRRRLEYSEALARMGDKTQVWSMPSNDHVTNRLTHVLRVASLSENLAISLGVNNDLARTIAIGHDIGHTPFGHIGEELLTHTLFKVNRDALAAIGAFRHNIQGVHVVDRIAHRAGVKDYGLNLTRQVVHGIASHDGEVDKGRIGPKKVDDLDADMERYIKGVIRASGRVRFEGDEKDPDAVDKYIKAVNGAVKKVIIAPATIEACIVFLADSLQYCPGDFDDMVRLGIVKPEDLPPYVRRRLGTCGANIIHSLVNDMVLHSYGKETVGYSKEVAEILLKFKREFLYPLYKKVNEMTKSGDSNGRMNLPVMTKVEEQMLVLFKRYLEAVRDPDNHQDCSIVKHYFGGRNIGEYFDRMWHVREEYKPYQAVVDYMAGFTDSYFFREAGLM